MRSAHEFVQFLVDSGALRFGDFVTKSGRRTPYFINTGEFRTGKSMHQLASAYAQQFMKHFAGKATNLYGPAYKGIPLCATTAMALSDLYQVDLSFTYNRKEAKDHGEGGLLVGDTYKSPTKIVIIEDVITAGTSVRETMELLSKIPNAQVVGLMVSVDRRERLENGQSALSQVQSQWGIQTSSIVQIDDIINYLEVPAHRAALAQDDTLLERIRAYRSEWGA